MPVSSLKKGVRVVECVTVLVANAKGEVLCVSRPWTTDKFTLPGGHVDPEDYVGARDREDGLRRAAARELREETGIIADPGSLVRVFAGLDGHRIGRSRRNWVTAFAAPEWSGSPWTIEPIVIRWANPALVLTGPHRDYCGRLLKSLGVA